MDVTNHRNRRLLICCVDHDLVSRCHSKDHPVGQIKKWDRVRRQGLLEDIWIESDACGVCLQAGKHKGRLAQAMLQETIHCVCIAAA